MKNQNSTRKSYPSWPPRWVRMLEWLFTVFASSDAHVSSLSLTLTSLLLTKENTALGDHRLSHPPKEEVRERDERENDTHKNRCLG